MKKIVLPIAALFCSLTIFGQNKINSNYQVSSKVLYNSKGVISNNVQTQPASVNKCGQVLYEQYLQSKDPAYFKKRQKVEQQIQNWIASHPNAVKKQGVVYTIPTVIHIVYNTSTQNVSDAQAQQLIADLNRDYRRQNPDTSSTPAVWKSIAADMEIEFCLAQIDPNGAPTTGIVRRQTSVTSFTINDDVKFTAQGGDDAWDVNRYFNIWICNLIGNILGYGSYPQSPLPNTYGAVVDYCTVKGTCPPYDMNRTTTHELSHCFNLYHIWGDDGGACSGSDLVGDTPNQANATGGCPAFPTTDACSPNYPGIMFMNYMDYTDDACMNLFTLGQKTRARAAIANYLMTVVNNSSVCNPNSPPTCNFTSDITTVTAGGFVNFTNLSSGDTAVSWSFPGGTPSSSTIDNPSIQYNNPGTYDVTIIAYNSFGSCTTTVANYITVVPSTGCDTLNFPPPGTLTIYGVSQNGNCNNNGWGYVTGWNCYNDISKANYFSNYSHYTHITGGAIYFYGVDNGGNGATVDINVWDATGTGGSPGNILGTITVNLSYLDSVVPDSTGQIISFLFPSPIPISSPFYMGIKMNNFGPGDSLGIVSNSDGDTNPGIAWEEFSPSYGGGWYAMSDATNSWGINIAMFISPYLTDMPPTANFTASTTSICPGSSITFDGTSSINANSYSWQFPGGTPSSSTDSVVTVTYNTPGNYDVYLLVQGPCGGLDDTLATGLITVSNTATAFANFTASATTVCAGDTITFDGTSSVNANSFSWTFNGGTPGSDTNSIVNVVYNTPGTYDVYLSVSNSCGGFDDTTAVSLITVTNASNVMANFTVSSTNLCSGYSISFDASNSVNASSYSWQFTGGTPSTSNTVTQNVTYNTPGTYDVYLLVSNNCGFTDDTLASGLINVGSPPTLSLSKTDANCGSCDGTANVSPNGGLSPYSYLWSNGATTQSISGLCAGLYTITVTDTAGCSSTDSITVYSIGGPTLSTSFVNASCFGSCDGSINLTVSGGTAPYSYSWSNGDTIEDPVNLCAGTYSVDVTDAQGCMSTTSVTISEPTQITSTASATDESCTGSCDGSITLSVSGGVSPYIFLWSNGQTTQNISNLCSGTYTVTITDLSGCSATNSATVNPGQTFNAAITPAYKEICSGQSVTISASGGTSYLWNTSSTSSSITVTPSTTTNYYCIVSNGNCSDTVYSTIVVNQVPQTVIQEGDTIIICPADTPITLHALGGTSYFWSTGDTTANITVSPTASVTTYAVVAINGNCYDQSPATIAIVVDPCTGIADLKRLENSISLYPNPVNDKLYIKLMFKSKENTYVTILNTLGQNVSDFVIKNTNFNTFEFDMSKFKEGLYYLRINTGEYIITKRFSIIRK